MRSRLLDLRRFGPCLAVVAAVVLLCGSSILAPSESRRSRAVAASLPLMRKEIRSQKSAISVSAPQPRRPFSRSG